MDQKSVEPLKMMVEKEQESKKEFLHVVRRYVNEFQILFTFILSNLSEGLKQFYSDLQNYYFYVFTR